MSNAAVTFGGLVNAITGAVDSAYTQGTSPSPVNSTALNVNIIGIATSLGSFLPGGAGAIVGVVGGAATGVGLGLNVGAVFLGATAADRASAGIGALGAIAGIIASNPFVPPQVRLAGLLAQAVLTGISGAISRDPALVNGFIDDLSKATNWLGDAITGIATSVNRNFQDAQNWIAPRDPLVLDLDNDGIEAIGINPAAPVLFDMDGDGIKTATGWIKADDGMLVLDRNGNGLIDSGRELFGDSTILTRGPRAGQTAANGYEALADLDINGDGVINSLDAAYASLRIWQDANQDGISQANELRTLSSLGIASLNVTGQASNINLGNGSSQSCELQSFANLGLAGVTKASQSQKADSTTKSVAACAHKLSARGLFGADQQLREQRKPAQNTLCVKLQCRLSLRVRNSGLRIHRNPFQFQRAAFTFKMSSGTYGYTKCRG